MAQGKSRKKKSPKRILALPDLEHAKAAVPTSLTSTSGRRTYGHAIREFVAWYCSEPRLAFNRTVVLRYGIHLEQRGYAPATINLPLAAVRRIAYEAADGLLSPELGRHSPRERRAPHRVRLGNGLTPERGGSSNLWCRPRRGRCATTRWSPCSLAAGCAAPSCWP